MASVQTLITGADGYVGRLLVRNLLATSDRCLLLWVRAASAAEVNHKCLAALGPEIVNDPRVRCVGGDLRTFQPFAGVDPETVEGIVHLAAVTAFTVDAETATSVNVAGTAKVLAFARRCPRLASLCLASTLYVSGTSAGPIPEAIVRERPDFANQYERSKWEAEFLIPDPTDLPFSIVRIATILADDESGRVGQFNAVHNTLRMLLHGLLSMMPGIPDTPIYYSTGDLAVRALGAALDRGAGVYHAVDGGFLTLGAALDVAFESYSHDNTFVRRAIRRPQFVDLPTFDMLSSAASGFTGSALGQALGSVRPFAPQLYVDKRIENDRFRRLLPGNRAVDPAALLRATCRHLADERGRREIA